MFSNSLSARTAARLTHERLLLVNSVQLPDDIEGTSLEYQQLESCYVLSIYHVCGYKHTLKSRHPSGLKKKLSLYVDPWLQYKED